MKEDYILIGVLIITGILMIIGFYLMILNVLMFEEMREMRECSKQVDISWRNCFDNDICGGLPDCARKFIKDKQTQPTFKGEQP